MAERSGRQSNAGLKPVPMKLFATWEVDRTPPNCIPRLCSLTLTRLIVMKQLDTDLTSIIIAVKMQSSKRTLRSNEISLPINGLLDTELELSFALQYPHFLKREGNKLQIMLQRRKRYKNRTILGFKTLAVGFINMSQVLQKSMDRELDLHSDIKDKNNLVAKVTMLGLNSQPVDHEESDRRKPHLGAPNRLDRSVDVDNYSDEEEYYTSNEEGSDSEPMMEDAINQPLKSGRGKILPARQRNLKQKFIALLKRFKVNDEVLDSEQDQDVDHDPHQQEIEDLLFDELEDLSDSGQEMDTMSISSTPKPSLRPFFSGASSSHDVLHVPEKVHSDRCSDESSKKADSDSHQETLTDHEQSDPPTSSPPRSEECKKDKKAKFFIRDRSTSLKEQRNAAKPTSKENSKSTERRNSMSQNQPDSSPRKMLLEQFGSLFPGDDQIPDHLILINTTEVHGQPLAQKLQEKQQRVISTCSNSDVRATFSFLVNKIQKFCNNNSRTPLPIKIVVIGTDGYINSVLRPYVEQFSAKSPDWQGYVKFLIVPLGTSILGKHLSCMDSTYLSTFQDSQWKEMVEKPEICKTDLQEIVNRVCRYISCTSATTLNLPIGEAMLMFNKEKCPEESYQIFIPFIGEVRIGSSDGVLPSTSVDLDDSSSVAPLVSSGSPPTTTHSFDKPKENTPPNSPSVNSATNITSVSRRASEGGTRLSVSFSSQSIHPIITEALELQVDYWLNAPKQEGAKKDTNKSTIKTFFKSIQVTRLSQFWDTGNTTLTMIFTTKEKKQKIMRLGKKSKEKDSEVKNQVVEGISRLVCIAKTSPHPLKVTIDGVEWTGVKFFQVSAQWPTHIKQFPIALFGHTETSC